MLILLVFNNLERYLTPKFGTLETFVLMATFSKAFFVRQLLSFYSQFYKVTMLESTNAIGEGKMQVYF
jgi:hypothetical protein